MNTLEIVRYAKLNEKTREHNQKAPRRYTPEGRQDLTIVDIEGEIQTREPAIIFEKP